MCGWLVYSTWIVFGNRILHPSRLLAFNEVKWIAKLIKLVENPSARETCSPFFSFPWHLPISPPPQLKNVAHALRDTILPEIIAPLVHRRNTQSTKMVHAPRVTTLPAATAWREAMPNLPSTKAVLAPRDTTPPEIIASKVAPKASPHSPRRP